MPERPFVLSAPLARLVARAWLLDLEDSGTVIGEDPGAKGTGEDASQVEDLDAGEETPTFILAWWTVRGRGPAAIVQRVEGITAKLGLASGEKQRERMLWHVISHREALLTMPPD
jgi:hypothetical protein